MVSMPSKVWVTFKASDSDIEPSERVVELRIDRPSIQIGRASKTLSKGLQGAYDNAWFDSPVMSRDHAKLDYDPETDTICITDVGSMHGTKLNNVALRRDEPAELNNGDEIIFGAEVRRGLETFPACEFQVYLEFAPYSSTNTYAFPESSELDEEEEFDFSENGSDNDILSADDLSAASPRPKISQPINAIDLTRDDSLASESLPAAKLVVDLTSEHGKTDMLESSIHSSISRLDVVKSDSRSGYGVPEIDDTESEDEQDHQSSDDEDHQSSRSDSDRPDFLEVLDSEEDEDDDENDELSKLNDYLEEDKGSRSDILSSDATILQPLLPETGVFPLNLDVPSNSEVASMESQFSQHASRVHPAIVETMQKMLNTHWVDSEDHSGLINRFPAPEAQRLAPLIGRSEYGSLYFRQPSPSDAAMAKTEASSSCSRVTAQFGSKQLGEGSGKEAFFQAREENKAVMQQSGAGTRLQASASAHSPLQILSSDVERQNLIYPLDEAIIEEEDSQHIKTTYPDFETGASEESVTVPEISMPAVQKSRPALRIDDIIDTSSPEQLNLNRKRKVEEISNAVEDEVRAWVTTIEPVDEPAGPFKQVETLVVTSAVLSPAVDTEQFQNAPPAKKARRVIENVAYAALGGVAVGLTLFGSLVATAPDFL